MPAMDPGVLTTARETLALIAVGNLVDIFFAMERSEELKPTQLLYSLPPKRQSKASSELLESAPTDATPGESQPHITASKNAQPRSSQITRQKAQWFEVAVVNEVKY